MIAVKIIYLFIYLSMNVIYSFISVCSSHCHAVLINCQFNLDNLLRIFFVNHYFLGLQHFRYDFLCHFPFINRNKEINLAVLFQNGLFKMSNKHYYFRRVILNDDYSSFYFKRIYFFCWSFIAL